MAAIGFFVICIADPYVLKKAQSKDRMKISKVYFHGKKSFVSRLRNKSCYFTIVKPTSTPMQMPSRQEAKTRRRAS